MGSPKKASIKCDIELSTRKFRIGNKFIKPRYGPAAYLITEESALVKYK